MFQDDIHTTDGVASAGVELQRRGAFVTGINRHTPSEYSLHFVLEWYTICLEISIVPQLVMGFPAFYLHDHYCAQNSPLLVPVLTT
jgi:hypothetical protein